MKVSGKQKWPTEFSLMEAIGKVRSACFDKQMFHLSYAFDDDPKGYYALNATFVVTPDELAKELHRRLNQAVDDFMREKGVQESGPVRNDPSLSSDPQLADLQKSMGISKRTAEKYKRIADQCIAAKRKTT